MNPIEDENLFYLVLYAMIKALGVNNTITFKMQEDLPLPKDGMLQFGYAMLADNSVTITVVEGKEAIEAIQYANNGDSETERPVVRTVGDGEDTYWSDFSVSGPDRHGGRIPNSH